MPDVHSECGASNAAQWMGCPISISLSRGLGDKGSTYAAEGTLAHSLAELMLRYNNGEITKRTFNTRLNKIKQDELYGDEMLEYITDYANNVWELFNQTKKSCPDAEALFEQRVNFGDYVPGSFGTADVVIVADGILHVIDLKYGKGVGVSAIDNPQLRLYGLGAYLEHSIMYDIQCVKTTIIQPRLDNISTDEIIPGDLVAWAEKEVKPKAIMAQNGEGEETPGPWCRWCKVQHKCRAKKEEALEMAKYDFAEANLLEDDEIADVLSRVDELVRWAGVVKDYAYEEALKGKKWDGWKLVEGRSNRKYTDETQVVQALTNAGYDEALLFEKKLLTITNMEKTIGKKTFAEVLGELVIKPEGKPTLVPETDKRPEISNNATDDFDDEIPQF